MKRFVAISLVVSCLLALSYPANAGWFSSLFKDEYTKTKYPIVLVHGFFGFDKIFGIDYFYRIPGELRRSGATVYIPAVSAMNSTEVRGEQLARYIEDILAVTGKKKVNLIGHSHGGPTVQYVASVYPHLVASSTSVGGVHWGSVLPDIYLGITGFIPFSRELIGMVLNALGGLISLLTGESNAQASTQAMYSLSTEGARTFNKKHPAGIPLNYCGQGQSIGANGVYYYSWSGSGALTNAFDLTDPFVTILALMFGERNDGLVSSCSSHIGKVLRDDYPMNHFDEVNHFFGLNSIFATDPTTLFRQHANRLKNQGL